MTKEEILEQNVVGKSFDNLVEHIVKAMQQYAGQQTASLKEENERLKDRVKNLIGIAPWIGDKQMKELFLKTLNNL